MNTHNSSPAYNSRPAACGCGGYPALKSVNADGEAASVGTYAAMGIKGGNRFKRLRPEQVAAPVQHGAGRGGRERKANHETHGRLYGDVRP